jgi:hypothetical protein
VKVNNFLFTNDKYESVLKTANQKGINIKNVKTSKNEGKINAENRF